MRFEGVETAFYLWINGHPVGYSQDSKLASEFSITPFLHSGENLMALQVMRYAESFYLEDQDYWYLSGIYRDVWLVSKPKQRIDDIHWTAIPDIHTGSGEFSIDVKVSREEYFADCTVRVSLYDCQNKCIAQKNGDVCATAQYRSDVLPTANTARIKICLDKVALWSPENPVLYTVVAELLSKDGEVLDIESSKFGFKLIEIKDGIVLLNGKRLLIRGVNRHDFCYKTGRAVSKEWMIEEIKQMKKMNINAVRTCHYPDSPIWYELCDKYGLLLVCECNIETHGVMGALTHNSAWAMHFIERAARMVEQLKNHVSIFSWSLGNESGTGANHAAMYGFIKEYDKTRLCQYEAGEPEKNISDIRGNMYATYDNILKLLSDPRDNRPIILVEYLYQIRNSGGGMDRFVELMQRYERFQGGFVWDWQDKCLENKTEDGIPFMAYGGDFNEAFVEGIDRNGDCPRFMTCNGIVLSDLTWKPVAYEVKQGYCPVKITMANMSGWRSPDQENHYLVRNECLQMTLSEFSCTAFLRENGEIIAQKEIDLPNLNPLEQGEIVAEISHNKKANALYTIEFSVRHKAKTFYQDAYTEIGLFQFELESGAYCKENQLEIKSSPTQEITDNILCLKANDVKLQINLQNGQFVGLSKNETDYLTKIAPCFDRAYTGLDAVEQWGWYEEYEKIRKQSFVFEAPQILKGDCKTVVEVPFIQEKNNMPPINGIIRYTLDGNGHFTVSADFHIDTYYKAIPRVGLECITATGFEELSYFGRGENENYCDRILSAPLGVYHSTVTKQHFPFVPPSQTGGHEETRWIKLNRNNEQIEFTGTSPFHFDALHHSIHDYQTAKHEHELTKREETIIHLDVKHAPIGSDLAWSTVMPKEHMLCGGNYHMEVKITVK